MNRRRRNRIHSPTAAMKTTAIMLRRRSSNHPMMTRLRIRKSPILMILIDLSALRCECPIHSLPHSLAVWLRPSIFILIEIIEFQRQTGAMITRMVRQAVQSTAPACRRRLATAEEAPKRSHVYSKTAKPDKPSGDLVVARSIAQKFARIPKEERNR